MAQKHRVRLLTIQNLGGIHRHQRDNTKTSENNKAKNPNPKSQAQLALETLTEAASSFQDFEVAHDAVTLPNLCKWKKYWKDRGKSCKRLI